MNVNRKIIKIQRKIETLELDTKSAWKNGQSGIQINQYETKIEQLKQELAELTKNKGFK